MFKFFPHYRQHDAMDCALNVGNRRYGKRNQQGIGLIFIREVLMKHGCTFSLRTYQDGITRFRIYF